MMRIQTALVMGIGLLVCVLLPPPGLAAGGSPKGPTGIGYEWSSNRDGWTRTIKYADIRNYAVGPVDLAARTITVAWQPLQLDQLGNICTVSGELQVSGDGQPQPTPVNWFQGVTVYMAKAPDTKLDWSKGMDEKNTLGETAYVSPDGMFTVNMDLRQTQSERLRKQPFQFGLALASHTGQGKTRQTVVWKSSTPAIPATEQRLEVPAAQPNSRALRMIDRASGWPYQNPDGVALIRAVNTLQRLGKQRALAALEEYVRLTDRPGYRDESRIVLWIIRVLFESIPPGDRIPIHGVAIWFVKPDSADGANWPLNPMAVVDDMPFMLGRPVGHSGPGPHPASQIEWARRHGAIRGQPLKPTANPLRAAESILTSPHFAQLKEDVQVEATRQLREQALAMVAAMLRPITLRCRDKEEMQLHWNDRLKQAHERDICWDTEREEFVAKGK